MQAGSTRVHLGRYRRGAAPNHPQTSHWSPWFSHCSWGNLINCVSTTFMDTPIWVFVRFECWISTVNLDKTGSNGLEFPEKRLWSRGLLICQPRGLFEKMFVNSVILAMGCFMMFFFWMLRAFFWQRFVCRAFRTLSNEKAMPKLCSQPYDEYLFHKSHRHA